MAGDRLLERLYPELHHVAAARLRRLAPGLTLETTEIVHEAFLRLEAQREVSWQNRGHFFAVAARVIVRTILDQARRRGRDKRGQGETPLPLEAVTVTVAGTTWRGLALAEALERLASIDAMAGRVVELVAIAGLSYDEAAQMLGVGRATVGRSWRFARAFLRIELGGGGASER